MLFLVATLLGLAAGALRGTAVLVLSPLVLVGLFGLAALVGAGPVRFLDLLIAVAGLNAGIAMVFCALIGVETRRRGKSA